MLFAVAMCTFASYAMQGFLGTRRIAWPLRAVLMACGVATVSLEFGVEFGWGAEMGDLYVLPEWRGKGLSRRLVQAIEQFLKERGATFYQVTVTPYALDAHDLGKFYEGLGFGSEGRLILAKML